MPMAHCTTSSRWPPSPKQAFPGYGEIITQVWRIKQLEYTWLRSLMRRYEDFSVITRDLLAYTLRCLGLEIRPSGVRDASSTNICISIFIQTHSRHCPR